MGRGVLGEEWSLKNLEKGGEETFDRWKTNLVFWETKQWYLEANRHGNKRPRLWKNTQALNHEESHTTLSFDYFTWKKFEYRKPLRLCYSIPKNSCVLRRNKPKNWSKNSFPLGKVTCAPGAVRRSPGDCSWTGEDNACPEEGTGFHSVRNARIWGRKKFFTVLSPRFALKGLSQ